MMQQSENGWLPNGRPILMKIGAEIFYHKCARIWLSSTCYFATIMNLAMALCRDHAEILHVIMPTMM